MTTTPNEPVADPEIAPAGDPGGPAEAPAVDPEELPGEPVAP